MCKINFLIDRIDKYSYDSISTECNRYRKCLKSRIWGAPKVRYLFGLLFSDLIRILLLIRDSKTEYKKSLYEQT